MIKKILSVLAMSAVMIGSAMAQDKNVSIWLSTPPGGGANAFMDAAKAEFEKAGYAVTTELNGSCVNSKTRLESESKKVLAIWETPFQLQEPCALTVDNKNFVRNLDVFYYYFCSVSGKTLDDWKKKGSSHTVGWSFTGPVRGMFAEFEKELGNKNNFVLYKNSSDLRKAILAKEIDFAWVSGGIPEIVEKGGACFFGTAPDKVASQGVPNLKKYFPKSKYADYSLDLFMVSKNMNDKEIQAARDILGKAVASDVWKKYKDSRNQMLFYGSTREDELREINNNVNLFKADGPAK